jgi:hypothetical protein
MLTLSVFAVQPEIPNSALSPESPSRWSGSTSLWTELAKLKAQMLLTKAAGAKCPTSYTWDCLTQSIRPWGSTPFNQWSADLGCCLRHWSHELQHDVKHAYWKSHGMLADRMPRSNNPYSNQNVVLGTFSFHYMADVFVGMVPDENQTKLYQATPYPVYTDNRSGHNYISRMDVVEPLISRSGMMRALSTGRSVTGPSDPPLLVVADDAHVADAGTNFGAVVWNLTEKTGRDAVALWLDDQQPYDSVRDAGLFAIPRLRQLYVTNSAERHEKVSHLPIGVSRPDVWGSILAHSDGFETRVEQRTTLLQCCCLTTEGTPGQVARQAKLAALRANGFECDASLRLPAEEYAFRNLLSRFVFSPSGNGRHNHRDFEAWMTGAVPVLDFDPNEDRKLYGEMPAVIVSNWSSVTPAFLEAEWARIQRKAQQGAYDMRQAYFPYWYARMHESIRPSPT